MIFNDHYSLKGKHAFLSPSKHHWMRYSEDKLVSSYNSSIDIVRGTKLHNLASELIEMGIRLPRTRAAINMFVNDAIGFRMKSEQVLLYSENAFGTADAISFRDNLLRIHDLKTGTTRVYMDQLMIYAAFFCLEYLINPKDIDIELRIYQGKEIILHQPEANDVQFIMNKVVTFDKVINELKENLDY